MAKQKIIWIPRVFKVYEDIYIYLLLVIKTEGRFIRLLGKGNNTWMLIQWTGSKVIDNERTVFGTNESKIWSWKEQYQNHRRRTKDVTQNKDFVDIPLRFKTLVKVVVYPTADKTDKWQPAKWAERWIFVITKWQLYSRLATKSPWGKRD